MDEKMVSPLGNQEGKRVQPVKINRWVVIGGVAVAVALALYLGLCAWVMGLDTFLPGSYISGVDVSGMTTLEVEETMNGQLQLALSAYPVTVTYQGESKEVDSTLFSWDSSSAFMDSYFTLGRRSFLTSGMNYLGRILGGTVLSDSRVACTVAQLEELLSTDRWDVDGAPVDASYTWDGDGLVITREVTGVTFDVDRAIDDIQAAALASLNLAGGMANIDLQDTQVTLYGVETEGASLDLEEIYSQLTVEQANAYMDTNYEIVSHVQGVSFDLAEAETLYQGLEEGESVALLAIYTQADMTEDAFSALLFADVLASETTLVSGTTDRKKNVELAAQYVDGTVLLPGETFSYNEAINYCTLSAGFFIGSGYVGGETVDVVGGGVCQVSSTLYYALLHTSLQITERSSHMYAVGYVPDGTDATYYTDVLDFKFTNNTDFPVKIETNYSSSNYLTVTLVGTETDSNSYVPQSSVYNYTTSEPLYKADSSVAQGTIVQMQTAYTGRTATVTRDVYDGDGTFLYTETVHTDVYKSRSAIYYYNPTDAVALGIPADYVNTTTAVAVPVTVPTMVPTLPAVTEPEVVEPELAEPEVVEPEVEDTTEIEPEVEEPELDDTTAETQDSLEEIA